MIGATRRQGGTERSCRPARIACVRSAGPADGVAPVSCLSQAYARGMDERGVNLVATLGTMLGDSVADAVMTCTGMSGAAPAGLAVLLGEPGMSVDTFARTVGVTGSGGVRLANRLASAGLVERRAGRDGREVSLWLTAAGRDAADQVLRARREAVLRSTATLDRAERTALVRIAEKILASVAQDRIHADWVCRLCDLQACPSRRCPVTLAAP